MMLGEDVHVCELPGQSFSVRYYGVELWGEILLGRVVGELLWVIVVG